MATLDADQLAAIRQEVGDQPSDADLQVIYDRNGEDLGALVVEVLNRRLSNLLIAPATFSVPGEYAQSNEANIIALREQLKRVQGLTGNFGSALLGGGVRQIDPEYQVR